ncbi:potassium channel family protein [Aurantibacillus circumpalustris]|uniref:potassium channel family protein n=1 Tax=Aurantibacillus circumpalustris TaxID=3036359 RepID=UPI00295B89EE|nr:ion channel [Aurantibacillus circumpalustris]
MLESPLHEDHSLRFETNVFGESYLDGEKAVTVIFYDTTHKKVASFDFQVITKEEVYDLIEKGDSLNISNSYIKDFSLSEYRKLRQLDKHTRITLKDFSARGTFFDCNHEIDFSYADFEGEKTIFESSVFANGFVNFFNSDFGHGDVNFRKAKFGSGSTSFRSVKFGDGHITFNTANFGAGNLSFVDANFSNGNVDYKNTYFGDGTVDFKFAKFSSGDITFERASFGKGVKSFKNVEFGGGKIDFKRIDFNNGDVSFEGVEFGDGKVSFRGAVFGEGRKTFDRADFAHGEAQFDLVNFGKGTISFNQAYATNISFRGCHLDAYIDLRFGECHLLDMRSTIVRDILEVKPEGEKVVIKEMILADMRILGRLFIDWRGNDVYDLIYNQKNTSMFQKAEQFRILKENFRNNGQYEDEDAAYLEFRRCEAKANLQDALSKRGIKAVNAYPIYYFQKYVFDYVGRYATAPTRVLLNAMLAVVLYALIFYSFTEFFPQIGTIASTLPSELSRVHDFWNSIYYSAITFSTVGYGDYFAEGYLKIFAACEGFTGIFLMSYFTVAFVRKILR